MTPEEALAECAATVRRGDPDRYFASLFAPAEKRPLLFALYAFDRELARVGEVAREPMMAEIRLQWWRQAVEEAREGRPPSHPAAIGLAEMFARASLPLELFEQLIAAHAPDEAPTLFAEFASLERHAALISVTLMRISALLLDDSPRDENRDLLREAGTAYGLVRVLCSIRFHTARGRLPERGSDTVKRTIALISDAARGHFARARSMRIPRRELAAVLPAALVPSYLARAARVRDPSCEQLEISQFHRQLVLLRAAMYGQL